MGMKNAAIAVPNDAPVDRNPMVKPPRFGGVQARARPAQGAKTPAVPMPARSIVTRAAQYEVTSPIAIMHRPTRIIDPVTTTLAPYRVASTPLPRAKDI